MRPTIRRTARAFLIGVALLACASAAAADDEAAPAPALLTAPSEPAAPAAPSSDDSPADDAAVPEDDAAASEDDDLSEDFATEIGAPVPDPLERMNRHVFRFNDRVDQWVLVPVTNAYQFVVPSPVRMTVRRFFRNLKSPIYFANNLLQLRFCDAAETLGRFVMNTTTGIGGLFDPASEVGWGAHPADFGQTLGVYGVASGPYLVIPLLGPTTLRDGTGDLVDRAFDPLTYLFGMGNLLLIGGSSGFVTREENAKALAALRSSSVDYYAALRSAYTQNRESRIAQIRERWPWQRKPQETAAAAP